nr:hypothetical protein [Sphingomonas sp. 66-10]
MIPAPSVAGRRLGRALLLCLASSPAIFVADAALAQDAENPAPAEKEVVVTAGRPRGAVEGPIAPELSIEAGAITSIGASSLADLIAQLSAQTGGSQTRAGSSTVVLLNGRRISSINEVAKLPPEAVARVEVLPEEAAIRFGYPAYQKVVNVVLFPSFASATGELEDRLTQATARNDFNTEANIVRISGDNRITFDLQYQVGDDLTEAQRGIVGAVPLRTLVPLTHQFTANGVFARALDDGLGFTGNGIYDRLTSRAILRAMQSDPSQGLARTTTTDTGHLGGVLSGATSGWKWSVTANADHIATVVRTAADGASLANSSSGIDDLLALDAVANGSLFAAPAGQASLTVKTDMSGERLTARDESGTTRRLTRRVTGGQVALDLPVLRRQSPLGAVSVGANLAFHDYSDVSAPIDRGWTFNWAPRPMLSLLVAGARESALPTIRQLGSPLIATPDIRFYDYGTGQTFTAARLDGGDPLLRHDVRTLFKAEAALKPAKAWSLIATYTDATTRDAILAFPGISPAFEAAFPGRIERDAGGAILSVDMRPLNIASETRRDLRFGVNFSKSWAGPAGPKLPGGGSFGGGHYFGASGTTLQFAIYDTWHLADRIVLTPGQASLDLIGANPLGEGLRVARHAIDAQLSATHHGFGFRANATWRGNEMVALGMPGRLSFGEPVSVNLRLFFFPAQQARLRAAAPWLEGVRFLLAIDNLFDQTTNVRDRFGDVPAAYQRGYLDALGRSFRLSVRKTFE